MSKHWRPDTDVARGRFGAGKRLRSLDEFVRPDFVGRVQRVRQPLPDGAKAGLVLVAAACVGVAIGMYQAFGPRNAIAPGAETEWSAGPAETIVPETQPDAADAEWEGRAAGRQGGPSTPPDQARGFGGRTGGRALVHFTQCHAGGGTNCVVDGDTFYIGGAKVRIAGIDAPETHVYRCASELALGESATAQLQALLNSGPVTMTGIGRDRDKYGRLLRNVAVGGQDVGAAMIAAGAAREYGRGRRSWC